MALEFGFRGRWCLIRWSIGSDFSADIFRNGRVANLFVSQRRNAIFCQQRRIMIYIDNKTEAMFFFSVIVS